MTVFLSDHQLPSDYLERVYAGVLGKIIGVYLGRPFENWTHQRIISELGHIRYYVHERLGKRCVVTDDDVSGTFVFVQAFREHKGAITAANIGKTWLNNVVERKSVFWWGGRGIATEHTAYLNLRDGIPAPDSGSIQVNGQTLAEQIGAQIFIDGWAMIAPGQPDVAAQFARQAALVSHDGESAHAATLWAAMEAEAFKSDDIEHLLATGLRYIPEDSLIARAIANVRTWVAEDKDWLKTRQRIEDQYGYDKFPGMCHVVPNHCVMIMAFLYGGHDFDLAMELVNTAGWDTDCNSGNVGCLVAIMHGMKSFERTDWRGPVGDRAIISSANNGYSFNNAARITLDLVNMGRVRVGQKPLNQPKSSQYHFTLPGSTQGFASSSTMEWTLNPHGPALMVDLGVEPTELMVQTSAPKFILSLGPTYPLSASPLVYSGQCVTAVAYATSPTKVRLRLKWMGHEGDLVTIDGKPIVLGTEPRQVTWTLPAIPQSHPIAELGVCFDPGAGPAFLDRLGWTGSPDLTIVRPPNGRARPHPFWDLQWVRDVSEWSYKHETVRISNDHEQGVTSYGTMDWTNYRVTVSDFRIMLGSDAILVRVQGLRRWYGLLFSPGSVSIVKTYDDKRIVLAEARCDWSLDENMTVCIEAVGSRISAVVQDVNLEAVDHDYSCGGIGFMANNGALTAGPIRIQPIGA